MPYTDELRLQGLSIPILIYVERRNSSRVSFTSKGINLRVSNQLRKNEIDNQITWCKDWARKKIIKKPSIAYQYIDRNYKEGSIISIFDQKYEIMFKDSKDKHIGISIVKDQIIIKKASSIEVSSAIIKRGVIKILNAYYIEKITARVHYINNLTVQKDIKKITLKYLKSQWGNCGTHGQIKLSTRILLLPERIQNAIILHELVHLVHFNHSSDFYDTVSLHMPDYKKRDRWLKEYEGALDF